MKLKRHFKLTRSKAILLLIAFGTAFSLVRFGSFKEQKAHHKARTLTIAKKALVESPAVPAVSKPAVSIPTIPIIEEKKSEVVVVLPVPTAPAAVVVPKKRFTVQRKLKKAPVTNIKEASLNKLVEKELASFDVTLDAVDIHGRSKILQGMGLKKAFQIMKPSLPP